MRAQRYHSVGLAVLSAALVLLSGSNVVATSSSSAPSMECTDTSISDGDCDMSNNTEECGYDGGDCCECTCVSTTEYVCGVRAGFACLDPGATCFVDDGDDDATTLVASDVTEQTSTPTSTPTSTEEPSTATSAGETATAAPTGESSATASSCVPDSSSDGRCDSENNNEECGYDGGDCCECTCVNTTENSCGVGTSFACVDPSASSSCVVDHGGGYDDDTIILLPTSDDLTRQTPAPTATTTPTGENLGATPAEANSTASSSCVSDSLSDGSCDADNNNEECGYDDGDCCECTCVSTSDFTCGDNGGYDCVDPNSSCNVLSVEGRSSAYRSAQISSPVYVQLAMCAFVLGLRLLSQ